MTRARIYLRRIPPPSYESFDNGWPGDNPIICHETLIESVEHGILIRWSAMHRTFVPDANIVLIEYEPCACPECVSAA